MTWKEKTVCRILLIIASLLSENADLKKDVTQLSAHISAGDYSSGK